jgi:steroid delta-isomerase-like uncharacterized protein
MCEDEAKAIVRRFFDEAWNQNRVATLDEYISTDNIHHGVSHTGPRGPEDTRQMMKRWRAAFPDVQYHIEALVAEDDVVAARTTMTATHAGVLSSGFGSRILPPNGKSFRATEMFIFRIEGGKVVELWATYDRLSVLEQLGAASAE